MGLRQTIRPGWWCRLLVHPSNIYTSFVCVLFFYSLYHFNLNVCSFMLSLFPFSYFISLYLWQRWLTTAFTLLYRIFFIFLMELILYFWFVHFQKSIEPALLVVFRSIPHGYWSLEEVYLGITSHLMDSLCLLIRFTGMLL